MKKFVFKPFSLVLIALALMISCKKNQIGGKATIRGTVKHHDKPIEHAIVYVKFNASEFPGEDLKLYDTYVEADGSGNYNISVYKGNYYLYAVGTDLDVPPPYEVKGGVPVTVKKRKDELTVDIAISGHN
ncbi:MAG: hypothetical protein K0R26_822 [Bacteroidota bacterium]|jgi:hypothetical protein|nr:hypothetical protein [Bacteroidota bacterium]